MTFSLKDSNEDLLATLSNAAAVDHPTVALAESARRAFRLLEPWCQVATLCSHTEVKNIINQIKAQAILYFQAIDMSIDTSRDGVIFAEDVEVLCDGLPHNLPPEQVMGFIKDMQQFATEAQRQAEETFKRFRSVRSGLIEIIATIPHATAHVLKDGHKAHRSKVRYERGKAVAEVIAKSASDNQLAGVVASILAVAGPALLVIPALLPAAAFAAEEIGERFAYKAEVRKLEEASCKDALTQLECISHDLDEVVNHVNGLARWWSDVVAMLKYLETSISFLRSSHLDTHRITAIRRKWSDIAGQYQGYALQISRLQDFYPASYMPCNLNIVGSSVRLAPTVASLAGQVVKCQQSVQNLQNASKYVPLKHTVQLQQAVNQLNAILKLEWSSLLEHLKEAQVFLEMCLDEDTERSGVGNRDFHRVSVEKLKETSQIVVDKHMRAKDRLTSQRDIISSNLSKSSWSPSKRRKLRSTANYVLGRSDPTPSDESDRKLVAFVEGGLDSAHPDGHLALHSLEEAFGELGSSLARLVAFWNSIEAVVEHGDPGDAFLMKGSPFCDLDLAALSSAIDSVTLSIDALMPGPRRMTLPQALGTRNDRHRLKIRKWLRSSSL